MGVKKTTRDGRTFPAKLDRWRLTSPDRARLEAAARLYGGQVTEWPEGQAWQLVTETDRLEVAVIPGLAVSQYFETWEKVEGGPVACVRRCDGHTELLTGSPCLCAAEADGEEDGDQGRACRPTTRLSVLLPRVAGIGSWTLSTRGYNSAAELAGAVQLLEELTHAGRPVPARLRLEERTARTRQGTRRFVVPVLDLDVTLQQVMDSIGGAAPAGGTALGQGAGQPVDGTQALDAGPAPLTPVPQREREEPPPVADQTRQAFQDDQGPPRANAAEPIPPTGLRPRAAGEAAGEDREGQTDDQPDGHPCDHCDFVAKSAAGLASHARTHRQEQEEAFQATRRAFFAILKDLDLFYDRPSQEQQGRWGDAVRLRDAKPWVRATYEVESLNDLEGSGDLEKLVQRCRRGFPRAEEFRGRLIAAVTGHNEAAAGGREQDQGEASDGEPPRRDVALPARALAAGIPRERLKAKVAEVAEEVGCVVPALTALTEGSCHPDLLKRIMAWVSEAEAEADGQEDRP